MARIDKLENFLSDVAVAIKEKRQTPDIKLKPENFDTEILSIVSGGASGEDGLTVEETVYKEMGSPVMAQALENFDSGDSFVGTKVTEVNPTITSSLVVSESINVSSGNGRVLIPNQKITNVSTTLTVYVKRDDNYISHEIPLPDLTNLSATSINSSNRYCGANNNGTKLFIKDSYDLIIIDFNPETLESSSRYYDKTAFNEEITKLAYSGKQVTGLMYYSFVQIVGDYLVGHFQCNYASGSYCAFGFLASLNGANVGTLQKMYEVSYSSMDIFCHSDVIPYEDSELIFIGCKHGGTPGYALRRIEIRDGEFYASSVVNFPIASYGTLTRNGKYLTLVNGDTDKTINVYMVDYNSGTLSLLNTSIVNGNQNGASIDETGAYLVKYNKQIVRISDGAVIGTINNMFNSDQYDDSKYLDLINGFVDSKGYLYKLTNTGEAEYLITHSGDGDIKGIVPKTMTMGDISEVRKLF